MQPVSNHLPVINSNFLRNGLPVCKRNGILSPLVTLREKDELLPSSGLDAYLSPSNYDPVKERTVIQ